MADSLKNLSDGLKTCANKKNADQVAKIVALVETFKNPETLALHMGHDILFNGVDIEKRINQAVTDYTAKSYVAFGQGLGSMLSEIAIGTQVGHQLEHNQYTDEASQIAVGLLKGAVKAEIKGDITKCLHDGTHLH
jgi:hypothetical protein